MTVHVEIGGRPGLNRRAYWAAGALLAVVLAIAVVAVLLLQPSRARPVDLHDKGRGLQTAGQASVVLDLPPPQLLRPITPEEAVQENAKRPFAARPDTPAAAFRLQADEASRQRALECLTQAVYYEAATEGEDGGRAVAQVVLNRMRHPAYPSSVCGVVYQGSERLTGCQFTFTCDGSLARIPAAYLWKQARRIATEALAGKVHAPVGHATHYHADYVLPYWADSLDKSTKIGRHIFYRLKGSWGSAGAFRQRYAGVEPAPPAPSSAQVALDAVQRADELLALTGELPKAEVPAGELAAVSQPVPQLVADASAGTLIADGGIPAPAGKPEAKQDDCGEPDSGNQLRPITANDVRLQAPKAGC